MPKHDVAQAMLKQSESELEGEARDVTVSTHSLTDVSATSQGGRAFTFTPLPPNASPAVELAVWWYDNLRREEEGLL
jgi:hypothetical protein